MESSPFLLMEGYSWTIVTTTGNWTVYDDFIVSNIQLSVGIHMMKIHILGPMNIDCFEFW